jgi:DNA-directed RNA polymerase subunit F
MFKFILPTILIGTSVAGFLLFAEPMYKNISLNREKIASYNEALDNSKALEAERDKLTQKYNSFDPENLSKLQKLLPDTIDNIRLILEMEKMIVPYGMTIKDIKYDIVDKVSAVSQTTGAIQGGSNTSGKDYGTVNLEFSTQGTYSTFLSYLRGLEDNLRIMDISSIDFSSNAGAGLKPSLEESYSYNFKLRTYWLKN